MPSDATRLPPDEDIARLIGIPAAVAAAIRAVESGPRPNPRAVRFECRLFNRDSRFHVPFTPPLGTKVETDRAAFEHAMTLDPATAVRSSSFGAFQTMGAHLLAVTGKGPVEALAAFDASPAKLSVAMLAHWVHGVPRFLEWANADPPDFMAIALRWNGKASYAAKLKAAYDAYIAKWPERG